MAFQEYTRHIDWSLTVGRRRTLQTARRAASTIRELEGTHTLFIDGVVHRGGYDPPTLALHLDRRHWAVGAYTGTLWTAGHGLTG